MRYNGATAPNLAKISNIITMFFFTIANNGQVSVVHSAKQYSGGLGNHGPAHNRILMMVGERMEAGILPWQMAPAGGLEDWVSLSPEYVVHSLSERRS
jgi:hypothetical protein